MKRDEELIQAIENFSSLFPDLVRAAEKRGHQGIAGDLLSAQAIVRRALEKLVNPMQREANRERAKQLVERFGKKIGGQQA